LKIFHVSEVCTVDSRPMALTYMVFIRNSYKKQHRNLATINKKPCDSKISADTDGIENNWINRFFFTR